MHVAISCYVPGWLAISPLVYNYKRLVNPGHIHGGTWYLKNKVLNGSKCTGDGTRASCQSQSTHNHQQFQITKCGALSPALKKTSSSSPCLAWVVGPVLHTLTERSRGQGKMTVGRKLHSPTTSTLVWCKGRRNTSLPRSWAEPFQSGLLSMPGHLVSPRAWGFKLSSLQHC